MTTVTMPETIGGINIDELTSADGKGVLDVMLGSIKALLHAGNTKKTVFVVLIMLMHLFS